jgi:hypothetical protein
MIGWRGPLTLAVSSLVLAMALWPDRFGAERMPTPLATFVVIAFVGLAWIGVHVCRFTLRRNRLVRDTAPRPCRILVEAKEDSEGTSYAALVDIDGATWRAPLAPRKATLALAPLGSQPCEAWCDEAGAPIGLRWNGAMLETIPVVARVQK